jgi:hypothetical protein
MSTLQSGTHHPHPLRTRLGAGLVGLGALVAIGVAILMLSLGGARHAAIRASAGNVAHPHAARKAVSTPAQSRYFRDPATHALLRVH